MKTHTISTFLRPATLFDVFDKDGAGEIRYNKQFFYKEKNGNFRGPYRMYSNTGNIMFSELTTKEVQQYLEIFQLLNDARIYMVDPEKYKESVAIKLQVKEVQAFDISENKYLIINTLYYKQIGMSLNGPFYINNTNKTADFYGLVKNKEMFCFNTPSEILKN